MKPNEPDARTISDTMVVSDRLLLFQRAVTECQAFLADLERAVVPSRIPPPRLIVSRDGEEIALSWTLEGCKIEIGFVGDGKYNCYAIYPDGTCFGTKGPLLDGFPEAVIQALRLDA